MFFGSGNWTWPNRVPIRRPMQKVFNFLSETPLCARKLRKLNVFAYVLWPFWLGLRLACCTARSDPRFMPVIGLMKHSFPSRQNAILWKRLTSRLHQMHTFTVGLTPHKPGGKKKQQIYLIILMFFWLWKLDVTKQGPNPVPNAETLQFPKRNTALRQKTKKTQRFCILFGALLARSGSLHIVRERSGAHF